MKVESNSTVLTRTKSKRSDHGKVKKLKRVLTKKFNSKSYETISLSKKEEVKKNVITFIHSNGLIQSDVNVKNNKAHHVHTNDNMDKSDKKRDLIFSNKENIKARRFSLPSPEILKELQNHKNKLSSSSPLTLDSLKSFSSNLKEDIYSHSTKKTSPSPSPNLKPVKTPTTKTTTTKTSTTKINTTKIPTTKTITTKDTTIPSKNTKIDTVKFNTTKSVSISKNKKVNTSRPKSKLSESVTLLITSPPPVDYKPSAPSLNEMYLEEVNDHQKLLQYKNLINTEQGHLTDVNSSSSPLSAPPPLIPTSSSLQNSSSVPNPFQPPFTTLSPSMTNATTTTTTTTTTTMSTPTLPVRSSSVSGKNLSTFTTTSPYNETLSHLPKPSSLSFYTQSPTNFDSVPPKVHGTGTGRDYSIEKVTPKIDLVSRRDSLDFYFDKLSQPCKSLHSSTHSSSHLNFPGPNYTSLEPDIPALEVSQHRMMMEPQPTYNVAHTNFNQVMKDTFSIRNKLEDKVEETKFQMMIAITQLNLINEQLDILNFNNLK